MHTKKTRIEERQRVKRKMDETSKGWSEGWMDGWMDGGREGGEASDRVRTTREICNEILVSQTGCYTLILAG